MKKILVLMAFVVLFSSMSLVSAGNDPNIEVMRAIPSDPYIYTTFDIYVRTEDNDGIDKIKFYNDGSLADTEYCDGDDECTVYFDVYESSPGYHTYKVKVYDEDSDVESKTIHIYLNKYYTGAIPPYDYCGNGVCNSGESCFSCPQDCGVCSYCGNGICSSDESCSNCPQDCGICNYCGNGDCGRGESCSSCPQDCGSCPISTPVVSKDVIYTCKQRGGQCCDFGGVGVIDGGADCPSACYNVCNANPKTSDSKSNSDSFNTPSGAVVVADNSFVILILLLLIFFVLLYIAMRK